jgi:hypothetical protein
MPQCNYVKPDGTRCESHALRTKERCLTHDPDSAERRAEGRRRGGEARRAAVLPADTPDLPLKTAEDVCAALADTFNKVRRGELDARVGNCLAAIGSQLIRSIDAADVEARVSALEEQLGGRPARRVAS